jgi:hypothetical protein
VLVASIGNGQEKLRVSSLSLPRQLPPSEHGRGDGSARQPLEAFSQLYDRFLRARIGQLPSHLPRLLGAVEPFRGFIQN